MGGIGKTTLAKVIFNEVSSKFQGCSFLSNIRLSSQGNGIVKLQQQILNDILHMSEIVLSTGGLPLALEVVGSHLFGQTKAVWRETLRKLKKTPHKEVQNALMISYESLEDDEKQIFLDIACFFRGIEKRFPLYVWESLDLCPDSGMNALCHKSLIKIVDGDRIWMHDQLRDLGREIVHKDGKSSRIWKSEDALRMISDRKGTRDVVLLDLGELSESCIFKKAGFKKLTNLRTLRLSGGNLEGDFRNCFPQLRWLEWTSFPSNFKAQNFNLPNLAVLILTKTDIDEGWTGWNGLLWSQLKVLELSSCGGLTRTPDFSACLGLEMLVLRHWSRLTEIDDSIGKLQQLTVFVIQGSPNLKGLPDLLPLLKRIKQIGVIGIMHTEYPVKFHLPIYFDDLKSLRYLAIQYVGLEWLPKEIGQLKLLEYLSLDGCSKLTSLPESVCELESLVKLNLMRTGLTSFSGQIENMKELKVLNMSNTNIRMLPKGIGSLAKLEEVSVSCCRSLEQIPSEIGNLFSLRILNLRGTRIVELPSTVSWLSSLQHLDMYSCWKLRKVKQLPVSLSHLSLPYFSLQAVPDLSNLVNLIDLCLSNNDVAFQMSGISRTDCEEVDVDLQTQFRSLDFAWIERMRRLKRLVIGVPVDIFNSLQVDWRSLSSVMLQISCSDAQSLSQLPPTVLALVLNKFQATILQMSLYPNLKNLVQVSIVHSPTEEIELRGLEVLGNLEMITVRYCQSLMRLSILSWPKKLNVITIIYCPKLVEVRGLEWLESLHELWFYKCPLLPRLPDFPNLVKLKYFRMSHCNSIERMPALPRTKHPFELLVADCGELRDFCGPHHLYWESYVMRNCNRTKVRIAESHILPSEESRPATDGAPPQIGGFSRCSRHSRSL